MSQRPVYCDRCGQPKEAGELGHKCVYDFDRGIRYAPGTSPPSRRNPMTAPTSDALTEALADTLTMHSPEPVTENDIHIGWACECRWGSEGGYGPDDHTRHVAAALVPVVAQQVEDARAEVAASVLTVIGPESEEYRWDDRNLRSAIRNAVSDAGVEAHKRQMRAEAWDEGAVAGMVREDGELPDNPYR